MGIAPDTRSPLPPEAERVLCIVSEEAEHYVVNSAVSSFAMSVNGLPP